MKKWNQQKLIQMTQQQNEFTKTRLDYEKIASNYFEIIEKVRENGDVVPLAFKDVEVAYDGKMMDDLNLPEVTDEIQKQIDSKEQERQIMHIKHFSRSITHEDWFNYLDEEIKTFIEKYPEYSDVII